MTRGFMPPKPDPREKPLRVSRQEELSAIDAFVASKDCRVRRPPTEQEKLAQAIERLREALGPEAVARAAAKKKKAMKKAEKLRAKYKKQREAREAERANREAEE